MLDGETGRSPKTARSPSTCVRSMFPLFRWSTRPTVRASSSRRRSSSVSVSASRSRCPPSTESGLVELWDALDVHLPEAEIDDDRGHGVTGMRSTSRSSGGPTSASPRSSIVWSVTRGCLVSEVPGTTRDAVDVICEVDGVRFRFVDTAGIRRKGTHRKGPRGACRWWSPAGTSNAPRSVFSWWMPTRASLARMPMLPATPGRPAVAWCSWSTNGISITNREEAREELDYQIDQHMKFLRQTPGSSSRP